MSEIQPINTSYNFPAATVPSYGDAGNKVSRQPQTVCVTSPPNAQIYQYPQTSLYNDPSKQAASGVNIFIYNPSAMGAPNSAAANVIPQPSYYYDTAAPVQQSQPIATAPLMQQEKPAEKAEEKTKQVVALDDNYIKTLESYLKSTDSDVRKTGIRDLIQRFEEDSSRYEDEALTALLNTALQDPDAENRLLAESVIAADSAHGDATTIELLQNLQSSDKLYGQEAVMARNALLNASHSKIEVPDNSPPATENEEEDDEEEENENNNYII